MNKFPDSWESSFFLNILNLQGGGQPPKSTFIYEPREGFVQLLQIRDFGSRSVPTYIRDTANLKKCRTSDILIARYGASLGRILTGLEGAYNVAMAKVTIPEEINRRFTFHLLNSEVFQAPLRLVSRSAQNGFNKNDLAGFQTPLPPLNEQKRIANKLDAVLARVDACRDRLDRIPIILKRFRQAVLAAATSGKLTEEWRLTNSKQIDAWRTSKGAEVFSFITSGSRGWAKYYSDSGSIFLRIGNLNHETIALDLSNIRYVNPPDGAEGSRTRVQLNDILISITADVGMIGLVSESLGDTYINQHICLARPKPEHNPGYLAYFLASPTGGLGRLQFLSRGATKLGLTLGDIRGLEIQLPSLSEQTEIVRRVESLFAYADRLEAHYTTARAKVEKLTPATLAKAFRGELVPQDPNDEPASELLARIRAQRNEQAATKPKRIRQRTLKN